MKLKIIDPAVETSFDRFCSSIWLTKSDFDKLEFTPDELRSPVYYKIKSDDTIRKFVFYAKLECLNPKSSLSDGYLYVPKVLMNASWIYENGMNLSIEKISLDNIHNADAVTIKLPKSDVVLWSENEVSKAVNTFVLQTGLTYLGQKVLLRPKTKDVVMGEVTHVYPRPKSHLEPVRVNDETKVVFEGLPENSQKVIDFKNIGGLGDLITKLREIIQIPLSHPELLTKFNIKPPKGLLMYGPPGNGKTMIARAVAKSMGSNFITIDLTDATSKYTGVAEQRLKEKFEEASVKGNSVIFIDEIDSIASIRNSDTPEHQIKIVSSLLSLMDGLNSDSGVFVIGATNRLNAIDTALRRPGRFDLEIEIPLPSPDARLDILSKYVKLENNNDLGDNVNGDFLKVLSELTTGYSGADISLLYREAVMDSIRNSIEIEQQTGKINILNDIEAIKLSRHNFLNAIKYIKPTSLRSVELSSQNIEWDNLIAFDLIKEKMTSLHEQLSIHYLTDNQCGRLSRANIVFIGAKGSGKRTLLNSFAKQYNYEQLTIDILDLFSLSLSDASKEIEDIFIKAKQISPSIIYVKNIDKIETADFYCLKIVNELEKLNNRNRIIAITQFEDEQKIPTCIKGYKGFNLYINFEELIDQNIVAEYFKNKLINYSDEEKLPIGRCFSILNEQKYEG